MSITVTDVGLSHRMLTTRIPFRYGIATLTEVPHVFVTVEADVSGRSQRGIAADILPPKWFTKDVQATVEAETDQMFAVIRQACRHAREVSTTEFVFDFWQDLHRRQATWGNSKGLPPLLTGFGTSLLERAVIDAYCRATGTCFAQAVRRNTLGIRLGDLYRELGAYQPADLLPHSPRRRLRIRHTVGLADPLTDADIPSAERLADGLPQSLEACIERYGLTHFKIKVPADAETAIERLRNVTHVVTANCREFLFTLDANEFFHDVDSFRKLWCALRRDSSVACFLDQGLSVVEQPLHRNVALSEATRQSLHAWSDRPPLIIDESGGDLQSLPRALECGYTGTSHKNCKGVFHGIANACLVEHCRREFPDRTFVITSEDLMNVGPVALLQDLAVAATIGVEHTERNGHHYVRGLSAFPIGLQENALRSHPDLYRMLKTPHPPTPTLQINSGLIVLDTIVDAPFGCGFDLEPNGLVLGPVAGSPGGDLVIEAGDHAR